MKRRALALVLVIALAAAVTVVAAPTVYQLGAQVIGSGGAAAGGGYAVEQTIGQPVQGAAVSGGGYTVQSGFWGVVTSASDDQAVYLPVLARNR